MAKRKRDEPTTGPVGPRGQRREPMKPINADAYQAGRRAHAEHASVDQPPSYPAPTLVACWEDGWRDAAEEAAGARLQRAETFPGLKAALDHAAHAVQGLIQPVPEVRQPEVKLPRARTHWPETEPLPTTYKRARTPCPNCKRLLMDDGSLAAVVTHAVPPMPIKGQPGKWSTRCNRFRCRNCNHTWKLAVE